jgi:starch synthase
LLQQATVLLLPSLSETFGLVLLEAWAAGTMVMASRTSGASALIEHGHNGWLFDLKNPATFHQFLDRTLNDPKRTREMTAHGTEKACDFYSVEATARRMKELYGQLIEEKQCLT